MTHMFRYARSWDDKDESWELVSFIALYSVADSVTQTELLASALAYLLIVLQENGVHSIDATNFTAETAMGLVAQVSSLSEQFSGLHKRSYIFGKRDA